MSVGMDLSLTFTSACEEAAGSWLSDISRGQGNKLLVTVQVCIGYADVEVANITGRVWQALR